MWQHWGRTVLWSASYLGTGFGVSVLLGQYQVGTLKTSRQPTAAVLQAEDADAEPDLQW